MILVAIGDRSLGEHDVVLKPDDVANPIFHVIDETSTGEDFCRSFSGGSAELREFFCTRRPVAYGGFGIQVDHIQIELT